MKTTKLKVNMHCASCAVKINKKLSKMGCEPQANAALRIVKVKHSDDVKPEALIKAIHEIGYDAEKI